MVLTSKGVNWIAIVFYLSFLFLASPSVLFASNNTHDSTTAGNSCQLSIHPLMNYLSDYGMGIGPHIEAVAHGKSLAITTVGYPETGARWLALAGMLRGNKYSLQLVTRLERSERFIYSPYDNTFDKRASGWKTRFSGILSGLRNFGSHTRFGLVVRSDIAWSGAASLPSGQPALISERALRDASQHGAGIRFIYELADDTGKKPKLTADISLTAGIADEEFWKYTHFDWGYVGSVQFACSPLRRLIVAVDLEGSYSMNAPQPLRASLGGYGSLRGYPVYYRYGRRLAAARNEISWVLAEKAQILSAPLHSFWDRLHLEPDNLALVCFYDTGTVGDPEFGWLKTLHGFGAGLRMNVTRRTLFWFEAAGSPDHAARFYLGFGVKS